MTEEQYIDATNLAKLRIAMTIVRDTLPMRPAEDAMHLAIRQLLRQWTDSLEPLVKITPEAYSQASQESSMKDENKASEKGRDVKTGDQPKKVSSVERVGSHGSGGVSWPVPDHHDMSKVRGPQK